MSKATFYALIFAAVLGVAGAYHIESTRLGRKLSALCHVDNCGVWCGQPRGGGCAVNKPPCYPPTLIDCYPPSSSNGAWSKPECPQFCGPKPWKTNPSSQQCGAVIYVCRAPPVDDKDSSADESSASEEDSSAVVHPPAASEDSSSAETVVTHTPEKGCVAGNSLPFGLENCICDGAEVGEPAGLAACGRVATLCASNVQPFGMLEAVQQVCDTFAIDACLSSSQNALVQFPACADLLRNGTPRCTPQQATSIWFQSVSDVCEPLCKDCARIRL